MSYNIPVVGTRTGGIPELLEGGAGLIVPEKNPAALADAIERCVRDPVSRRKSPARVGSGFVSHSTW